MLAAGHVTLPGEGSQVDLDLLVAAEHADGRVESSARDPDLLPADRLPVPREKHLKHAKNKKSVNFMQS